MKPETYIYVRGERAYGVDLASSGHLEKYEKLQAAADAANTQYGLNGHWQIKPKMNLVTTMGHHLGHKATPQDPHYHEPHLSFFAINEQERAFTETCNQKNMAKEALCLAKQMATLAGRHQEMLDKSYDTKAPPVSMMYTTDILDAVMRKQTFSEKQESRNLSHQIILETYGHLHLEGYYEITPHLQYSYIREGRFLRREEMRLYNQEIPESVVSGLAGQSLASVITIEDIDFSHITVHSAINSATGWLSLTLEPRDLVRCSENQDTVGPDPRPEWIALAPKASGKLPTKDIDALPWE